MEKPKVKKNTLIMIGFLSLCMGILIALIFHCARFVNTPLDPSGTKSRFLIQSGDSLSRISENLMAQQLISNKELFKLFTRFKGYEKTLQTGEYNLAPSMTPKEILDRLSAGKVNLYRLTIPEGFTIIETAALVEKAGFGDREGVIALCKDAAFTRSFGIKADSLEGYLFPETYFFEKTVTHREIIKQMVDRFNAVFTREWGKRAEELGYSRHEIVILASIIEKETGDAPERPLIASVFHNRLKRRMRLESDPTVIYGIPDFNGNITRKDLRTVTPYNTYKIHGFPKGPIANPGALSLKAALYPADTQFLYFVSKKDTTHKFSKTIGEHNRAVRKYQLGK